MTIHIYTIAWNNEFILPYFLKHYEKYADRIFVADHQSTDKTAEIAKAHPKVTYIEYNHPTYDETQMSRTLEKLSKQYFSDWAVFVDTDEFVQRLDELDLNDSGSVLGTTGYMMVGKSGKLEDCKMVRMPSFDKPIVFDPRLDVRFGDGRHTVNLPVTDSCLELWHYKYPSREYYLQRALDSYPRMMSAQDMSYRIKRGLVWYDRHIG